MTLSARQMCIQILSCSLICIKASDTDFVSASATRTFTATDTTDKCIDITTNEDNVFEANEMFTVSLSVVSPTTGVTIQRRQTTVVIMDDDGRIIAWLRLEMYNVSTVIICHKNICKPLVLICLPYIEVMVEITTSGEINSDGNIHVDEGLSVEVCVGVSGGTISDREVVVRVATSDLDDVKAASKYYSTYSLYYLMYVLFEHCLQP